MKQVVRMAMVAVPLAMSTAGMPAAAQPNEVTCSSESSRQVECPMNTRGGVKLARQLSKAPCVEGRSWGLNRKSVWVKDGCRAVFVNTSGQSGSSAGGNLGPVSRAAIDACNRAAKKGYDGTVVEAPARNGYWEVVLRFEDDRYTCLVTTSGAVVSFYKMDFRVN